jgi:hypothetical protein
LPNFRYVELYTLQMYNFIDIVYSYLYNIHFHLILILNINDNYKINVYIIQIKYKIILELQIVFDLNYIECNKTHIHWCNLSKQIRAN